MGFIRANVKNDILVDYPEDEKILFPLLNYFDITHGKKTHAKETFTRYYFLKPLQEIKNLFGFQQEIVLVYAPYQSMQAKYIDLFEYLEKQEGYKSRLEKFASVLVSEYYDVENWVDSFLVTNENKHTIISFYAQELRETKGSSEAILNKFKKKFFSQDLFDYSIALSDDTYFFGRDDFIQTMLACSKKVSNMGIFGLRKVGKTSLLNKIIRIAEKQAVNNYFFIDCKIAQQLAWNELLGLLTEMIAERNKVKIYGAFDEKNAAFTLGEVLKKCKKDNPGSMVMMFDDYELITPRNTLYAHWEADYLKFWQAMWALQNLHKNLSIMLVGVSPLPIEIPRYGQIQNPLVEIIPIRYLTGLGEKETRTMVNKLSRVMGLYLDEDAIAFIHSRTSGHPRLVRAVCSSINRLIESMGMNKPAKITKDFVFNNIKHIEDEITPYAKTVISELQTYYPDEYEMLEYVASKQYFEFNEMARDPIYVNHLKGYRLIDFKNKVPVFEIPMIGKHIGNIYAQKERRQLVYKVVDRDKRTLWCDGRSKMIVSEMDRLCKTIDGNGMVPICGTGGYADRERIKSLRACDKEEELDFFVNTINQIMVEPIDIYGNKIKEKSYFWNKIKSEYPYLWPALKKIKLYRIWRLHKEKEPRVETQIKTMIQEDFEGKLPEQVPEYYFIIQQIILDTLMFSLVAENDNLENRVLKGIGK